MNLGFGRRFCLAVLIFVVGLHLIGWGIQFNGTAGPSNPVWPMISAMFALERWILAALLILTALGAIIAILTEVARHATSAASKPSDYVAPRVAPLPRELPRTPKLPISNSNFLGAPQAPAPQAGAQGAPLLTSPEELRLSEPSRPPTAEALREQALKQIIGG